MTIYKTITIQLIIAFLLSIAIHPNAACADASPKFTQLKSFKNTTDNQWLMANYVPKSKNQFFVIDDKNNVLLTNNSNQIATLVDGKRQINHLVKFSAFTLHPNFSQPEQYGAYTFYTAHIEMSQDTPHRKRIPLKAASPAPFDNVVLEWQLKPTDKGFKLVEDSKRELIRIPLPHIDAGISHLTFNPFIKNWQKHFGLLFLTLPEISGFEQHPLYSGSLIRINPASFGLRAYTIPADNPFTLDNTIHPEVAATGLGKVTYVQWLKEEVNQFAINDGKQMSIVALGADWRRNKSRTRKSVEVPAFSNMLYFRHSDLNTDLLPFLLLKKKSDSWALAALSLAAMTPPSEIMQLPFDVLQANAKPLLFKGFDKQLMIFDLQNKVISTLSGLHSMTTPDNTAETANIEESKAANYTYIVILTLSIFGIICFLVLRNQEKFKHSKKLLHKHYARFEADIDNRQVHLYLRHHEEANKTLSFGEIGQCKVLLNDSLLVTIDKKSQMSNAIENAINSAFREEKRHKMIDNKVRKISMILADTNNKASDLCLYLREGNQRLTKLRFEQVQTQVIDWLWLLSNLLNPDTTEQRKFKEQQSRQVKKPAKTAPVKPNQDTTTAITANTPKQVEPEKQQVISRGTLDKEPVEKSDELLIDSLNKLLELKTQGFLTEEEFSNSKAKIIAQLSKE